MRSTVYLLIGLPYTGKTRLAEANFKKEDVISEQIIRVQCQCSGEKAVEFAVAELKARLRAKRQDIVIDGRNLTRKVRREYINAAKAFNAQINAIMLCEDFDVLLQRMREAAGLETEEYMRKRYSSFQVPASYEGFHTIDYAGSKNHHLNLVDFFSNPYKEIESAFEWSHLRKMMGFDQRNPRHRYDLFKHSFETFLHLRRKGSNADTQLAGLYHDVGKLYTQTIDDDGKAHYYGHENISAQIAINELLGATTNRQILRVSTLIQHHMEPYRHKMTVEFAKMARRFEDPHLLKDLLLLHEADYLCH